MPQVLIYARSQEHVKEVAKILLSMRKFIAKELTCKDRALNPEEISLQVIVPTEGLPLADLEVRIIAHSYPERVKEQDNICLRVKNFISQKLSLDSVFVWLQLNELGHSFND